MVLTRFFSTLAIPLYSRNSPDTYYASSGVLHLPNCAGALGSNRLRRVCTVVKMPTQIPKTSKA